MVPEEDWLGAGDADDEFDDAADVSADNVGCDTDMLENDRLGCDGEMLEKDMLDMEMLDNDTLLLVVVSLAFSLM